MPTPSKERDRLAWRLGAIPFRFNQGGFVVPYYLTAEFGVHQRTIRRDLYERFAFLQLEKAPTVFAWTLPIWASSHPQACNASPVWQGYADHFWHCTCRFSPSYSIFLSHFSVGLMAGRLIKMLDLLTLITAYASVMGALAFGIHRRIVRWPDAASNDHHGMSSTVAAAGLTVALFVACSTVGRILNEVRTAKAPLGTLQRVCTHD